MKYSRTELPVSTSTHRRAWRRFLLCGFGFIFGLRAFLVAHFGAPTALVDEWEETGRNVLGAWHAGTFSVAALIQAHNGDHRIVATRLWEIFWYVLNGSWNPQLVMIAKSAVYAAAATFFVHLFASDLRRHRFVVGGVFIAAFAFPFGYQNMLWAFQSQFDFFLLAAAVGWWALVSGRTVLSLLAAAAAPLTLGAGPIVAASYVGYAAVAWWRSEWKPRRAILTAGVSLILMAVGLGFRTAQAAPLGSPPEQAFTFLKLLAWPYSNLLLVVAGLPGTSRLVPAAILRYPDSEHSVLLRTAETMRAHPPLLVFALVALALVMVLPLVALAWHAWRGGRPVPGAPAILGLGGFVLLLQAASALARSGELLVQTRYIDVVALVGFTSAAAAFALGMADVRYRRLGVIWAVLVLPGYAATMGASAVQVAHSKHRQWVATVQAYFPRHDRSALPWNSDWQLPILEPDPTAFENLLDDPRVEAVLPRVIVHPDQPPRPVARIALLVGRSGLFLAGISALLAGWVAFGERARRGDTAPDAEPAAVRI